MKFTSGHHTIDHCNTEAKEPIPLKLVSRGAASTLLKHEINAELFWPEKDFNFHQIPPDKVAIGIAWMHDGHNITGILSTKAVFISFFEQVKTRKLCFQCMWAEKEIANAFFNKKIGQ